jgi:prepilin-type N-terminal cleavage/methylation domain-containing protein
MKGSAFTLIEILIVISILAVFMDFTLTTGIDAYDRTLARSDRTLLVSALREARSEAVNSISSHGVDLNETHITIFEGQTYASRNSSADVVLPLYIPELVTSSSDVTFAPLTGDVSSSTSLAITGIDYRTEEVLVTEQGAIFASTTAEQL